MADEAGLPSTAGGCFVSRQQRSHRLSCADADAGPPLVQYGTSGGPVLVQY